MQRLSSGMTIAAVSGIPAATQIYIEYLLMQRKPRGRDGQAKSLLLKIYCGCVERAVQLIIIDSHQK